MMSPLSRIRSESGQAIILVVGTVMVFVVMAAVFIDAGSWFRADRHIQTAADAAALAGAQELPLNTSLARDKAKEYALANYADMPDPTITFPDAATINVVAEDHDVPGIFAPIISDAFKFVTVHAEAEAKVFAPEQLKNVAPIAVQKDFACVVTSPSCFGQTVTADFGSDNDTDPTKGKFGLLDLDRDGKIGTADMKNWLTNGYPDYLPINTTYPPANGEKNGIKKQLEDAAAAHRVLLFPVYDTADASGYHIIGWAAFVIDSVVNWAGPNHVLTGHFVTFIATDVAAGNPITDPNLDFGVHVITLTK
jgi:Putative Flp pilus-assembly TadE/G-like